MEFVRSAKKRLKVKTFTLNSKKEIISKITREVLTLFRVEIVGSHGDADYAQLSVINKRLPVSDTAAAGGSIVRMQTTLMLFAGRCRGSFRSGTGGPSPG